MPVMFTNLSLLALASITGSPKALMRLVLVVGGVVFALEMTGGGVGPLTGDWGSVYLKSATLLGVVLLSVVGVYRFMVNATETVKASRKGMPWLVNGVIPAANRQSGNSYRSWSDLRLLVYVGAPVAALYALTFLP